MSKGQTFFVLSVLLAGLAFISSGVSAPPPPARGRVAARPEQVPPLALDGFFLGATDVAWASGARNIFQAPRETESLPPIEISTPPLPALPHPGLPLLPAPGGALADKARFTLVPDSKINLGAGTAARGGAPADSPAASAANAAVEEELDSVTIPGALTFAERLRLSTEERLKRDVVAVEARKAVQERRQALDMVQWASGEQAWGALSMLDRKLDRFEAKRRIDALRSNAILSEDDRRRQLETIQLVFREDRGAAKPAVRQVVSGAQVLRVEFAATALNRYSLRRLEAKDDDLVAQETLARELFDAGEFATAATHLSAMLVRGQNSLKAQTLLADCEQRLLRYDGEQLALARAKADYPADAGLLARDGLLSLRLGLLTEAQRALRAALEKDPGCALAHLGLARIALRDGDAKAAVTALRDAESGTGLGKVQLGEVLVMLGEAWLALGDEGNARSAFDRALDQNSTDPRALCGSAVLALLAGGPDAAKLFIDRGRAANPYDGRLALLDGVAQFHKGAWAAAREAFQVATELDPLSAAKAFTALSILEEKAGKLTVALGTADAALAADPQDMDALAQRARVLFLLGDFVAAREAYLRVLEARPLDADMLAALGDCHLKSGGWFEAARFYARSLAADATYPDLAGRTLLCSVKRRRFTESDESIRHLSSDVARVPIVQAATAMHHYARAQTEEALRRLRLLAETKSAADLAAWALGMQLAVEENLNKEVWTDAFGRSGGQLLRGWQKDVGGGYARPSGVNIAIDDGRLVFRGRQSGVSDQPTLVWQDRTARLLQTFSADLEIKPAAGVLAGVSIMAFNKSTREPDPWPGLMKRDGGQYAHVGLQVAVSPEGRLVWRKVVQGKPTEWTDSGALWPADGRGNVTIALVDGQKSIWRVLLDGQPAMSDVEVAGLARRPGGVEAQVFCQAGVDKDVSFSVDSVKLTTWRK
ncbi:MAG: tetratricopeptide repeat protein [Planctomycetes bacterium]|nr:tetratricopeptide repeat protein [Planctomycetota bacterium]